MKSYRTIALSAVSALTVLTAMQAAAQTAAVCNIPVTTVKQIQAQLDTVVHLSDGNGGIFKPNLMWSAIVDRNGTLCSVNKTGDAWPTTSGSA